MSFLLPVETPEDAASTVPDDGEFKLTRAQDKALQTLTSDAMYHALGGGSRCLSGDTILDGHAVTVAEQARNPDKQVRVLTTHGYQMVDAPFKKGRAELLHITTTEGRSIKVTPDHRFWSGTEWVRADSLQPNSPLASLLSERNLLLSSSGLSLSGLREGAQRLTRRLVSYLDRCFGYYRQCDPRLPPSSTDVQDFRASLSGEQVHNLLGLSRSCHASLLRESGNRTDLSLTLDEVCTLGS